MSSDRGAPPEPDNSVSAADRGGLTQPPRLVRVDKYGSVSGLVRVRVPLGWLVINTEESEVP